MDTENKEDLFSIRLNSEGINSILRFGRIVKIYVVVGIFFTMLAVINDLLTLLNKSANFPPGFLGLYIRLYPFLSIGATIAFILQLLYFHRLSRSLKQAVEDTDELSFNAALVNLSSLTRIAIVITSFSIVVVVFNLVFTLIYRM